VLKAEITDLELIFSYNRDWVLSGSNPKRKKPESKYSKRLKQKLQGFF
jgi:hypothetical protein